MLLKNEEDRKISLSLKDAIETNDVVEENIILNEEPEVTIGDIVDKN
ncbi:hypothetical protein [Tissierella sp. P1]|nr:hypothetical protein [Tissierella sp. P1]